MKTKILLSTTLLTLAFLSGCAAPTPQPTINNAVPTDNTVPDSTIPTDDSGAAGIMPTLDMRIGENAIYVADIKPGNVVKAPLVATEKPAFVVIHKDNNDKVGAIIGVSRLITSGETQSVTINLTESTTDGQKLYAMLHVDDGDGAFDASKDQPARDGLGNELQMTFYADNNAPDEPAAAI